MTTNHRPTLESKRGKVISVTDSIVHARQVGQNQSLKLRSDVNPKVAKRAWMELKEEQANEAKKQKHEGSEARDNVKNGAEIPDLVHEVEQEVGEDIGEKEDDDDDDDEQEEASDERYDSSEDEDEDEEKVLFAQLQKLRNSLQGVKDDATDGKSESESESQSASESGSDSEDSEDEEEALLAELNAIKRERAEAQQKEKKELSNASSETAPENETKKSWRSSTSFRNKAPASSLLFTNNTLKSKAHKDFLSRYVK